MSRYGLHNATLTDPPDTIRYRLLLWHALKSLIYRTEPTDATQLCIDYFDSTNPIYTSMTLQGWRSIVMKACLSVYLSVCLSASIYPELHIFLHVLLVAL